MRWAVYYADGSRVTDADMPVFEVPPRGVITIGQENERAGRIFIEPFDYYWWMGPEKGWFGGDLFGLFEYLFCWPGWKKPLAGRSVIDPQYEAVMEIAREDDYLPEKSARHGYRERDRP